MPVIASYIVAAFNFTEFMDNPIEFSFTPIQLYLGILMWPVIFAVAIGLTYKATQNMGAVVAAIFIVFALFGSTNAFIQVPELSQWFFIVAVLGWAGVFLTIFIKKRFEN